MRLESLYW